TEHWRAHSRRWSAFSYILIVGAHVADNRQADISTLAVISKEQLRDIWLQKIWAIEDTFHLYVHNPFCLTECVFCKHQGLMTKIGSEIYETYYPQLLPKVFSGFETVIRSHPVKSI